MAAQVNCKRFYKYPNGIKISFFVQSKAPVALRQNCVRRKQYKNASAYDTSLPWALVTGELFPMIPFPCW